MFNWNLGFYLCHVVHVLGTCCSGLNGDTQKDTATQKLNKTLFGRRLFADVVKIKDLEMYSYCIRERPMSNE